MTDDKTKNDIGIENIGENLYKCNTNNNLRNMLIFVAAPFIALSIWAGVLQYYHPESQLRRLYEQKGVVEALKEREKLWHESNAIDLFLADSTLNQIDYKSNYFTGGGPIGGIEKVRVKSKYFKLVDKAKKKYSGDLKKAFNELEVKLDRNSHEIDARIDSALKYASKEQFIYHVDVLERYSITSYR